MPIPLKTLGDLDTLPFDEVIDVRSPAEYAEDHLPGAVNLPVLSDTERARVGTIYVQQDRFLARKVGAALVARNAAAHLEDALADRDGGYRPLVYCWRGGQRSGSFTGILQQIGWRADTIEGGYRSYRRLVSKALYETVFPAPIVLIDGGTGTAKTRLLGHLADQGAQSLDLEDLANHRGSVFGSMTQPQPAQKGFESLLADRVRRLDPARPVFVEAESTRIGRINLPPALATAMKAAPAVRITAPVEARVGHLMTEYSNLGTDPARIEGILDRLVRFHGHETVAEWRNMAAKGEIAQLVEALITRHYDPRYTRMAIREATDTRALPDLSDDTLACTARDLVETFSRA
jgi:tRNA 2-selenouridine synthase